MSFERGEEEMEFVEAASPSANAPPLGNEPLGNEPHFLHPTSILFDILSHARRNALPAVMALFGAARGNQFWIFLALLALAGWNPRFGDGANP